MDESIVTNREKSNTQPQLYLIPEVIEFLGYDPMLAETKTLAERLLRYRKTRGMSQKELAKQIGIDPTTLGRLEGKKGRCFSSILTKVIAFLGTHTLVGGC